MVQKRTLTIAEVVDHGDYFDIEFDTNQGATLACEYFRTKPLVGDKLTIETWGGIGSLITAFKHAGTRVIVDPRAYGRRRSA